MTTATVPRHHPTSLDAVVRAPIWKVRRHLNSIVAIVRCLPSVDEVVWTAEDGDTLTIRQHGADDVDRLCPLHFRICSRGTRVDWEVSGSSNYRGTLDSHGDAGLTQLHSTLWTDDRADEVSAGEPHRALIRRLRDDLEGR